MAMLTRVRATVMMIPHNKERLGLEAFKQQVS